MPQDGGAALSQTLFKEKMHNVRKFPVVYVGVIPDVLFFTGRYTLLRRSVLPILFFRQVSFKGTLPLFGAYGSRGTPARRERASMG
jgi:hypothetical protein